MTTSTTLVVVNPKPRSGTGPYLAGCSDFSKRFKDEASAQAWLKGVEAHGACKLPHAVLFTGPEA